LNPDLGNTLNHESSTSNLKPETSIQMIYDLISNPNPPEPDLIQKVLTKSWIVNPEP
jgi:hypothetical protein